MTDRTDRHRGDTNTAGADASEREQLVTALHDISTRLCDADGPEQICATAVETGAELLGLTLTGVWLLDEEYNRLDPVAATADTHEVLGGLPQFAENEGLIWDVFRSGDAELFDDLRDVPGVYNDETPIRSELIVPIGDRGVLMAGALDPGAFDPTDLELASILASNVETALKRTERERTLRRRNETLQRQRERMETVATVLARDIEDRLSAAQDALSAPDRRAADTDRSLGGGGQTAVTDDRATAREELDAATRLVADVRELAGAGADGTPRRRVSLADAAVAAADRVDGVAVRVHDEPTLRTDRHRFERCLVALFRFVDAETDRPVSVCVGRLDDRNGFYVGVDSPSLSEDECERVLDPEHAAAASTPGLGPALAAEIAAANGWRLSITTGETSDGVRFEVDDVTTISQ
ncbi:Signal transduction histidine kinase [Natronoarchaeum philippinense]|uniref:Signal transduction histidine kinase n=1 Tax=Natronoarchaeum philippinense TaxID=558529 RepID=A0A285N0A8_NATPI|nr:GAF domain-containing protein [Natronoarchaeum philippinense]SNZ02879.1 Signal transduction histidine kinase [Natronoarchaeum philippinense]